MKIHRFENSHLLNQHFAQKITVLLTQAIDKRGHAFFVVSGGKTPVGLFNILARADLQWEKITIILTDERLLTPTEKDSNERLVKETLLQHNAAKAGFISLYHEKACEQEGETILEHRLSALPTFDVVILGMGEDGHTASLFPCSAEIGAGLETKASFVVVKPTKAPYKRVSLTKTRLANSRTIFLHLLGENKLIVLNKAISGNNALEMPIRAFLHHPMIDLQVMFAP
ncbi:6-phosphogluconolactonase [Legionella lansingensis]|uniref:6-phosphogluconolactonase n=1 Tax=Legionella lansingensis TaxID=45067 RepID=A0A0W0VTT1_9GAMM|nr:6-phosphogluconolactonase [Legionella lansingensis]KTD23464.1 6-phosphogluconolactonase [Legionella lansingensis]SNV50828.1 6-phosphogluconolactonase [Legionella lansingensis]